MKKQATQVTVNFPPETFVAMQMLGLEGEKLAIEMKRAMAVNLFRRRLLSIGKAAELAEMCLADFMSLLAENNIPITEYTVSDLQKDLKALEGLET